ncbi:hypothetical protein [Fibrella forsythiae]|uniref:Uncharacterized protein n=1 Tax=Fibrella forsythiae TaxID=2817061 RepID=A0ABS3JLK6_9BACT|nr:hypothetical protein [Fibrella forsythiae]MBO0950888.1 hypothetical protein [Fibrella forsythiae]
MDINTWLTAIGLIVAIFFGLPPFLSSIKNKKPTLYLFIDKSIDLLKDISVKTDDLKVTYRSITLKENTFLLKLFICYIGSEDISKSKVTKYPTLSLPKNAKVHSCEVIESSEGINPVIEIINNEISFTIDLMKNEEFFYFEVLVSTPYPKYTNLAVLKSRIDGVSNHETIDPNAMDMELQLNSMISSILSMSFFICTGIMINILPGFLNNEQQHLAYNKSIFYYNKPINIDQVQEEYTKNFHDWQSLKKVQEPNVSSVYKRKVKFKLDSILPYQIAINRADSILDSSKNMTDNILDSNEFNLRAYFIENYKSDLGNNFSVLYHYKHFWVRLIYYIITTSFTIWMLFRITITTKKLKISNPKKVYFKFKKHLSSISQNPVQ